MRPDGWRAYHRLGYFYMRRKLGQRDRAFRKYVERGAEGREQPR